MINLFNPSVGPEEIDAIESVIRSRWLGKGKVESHFKSVLANYLSVEPGNLILTTSCTEALFAVLKNLDLDNDSEVVVPTISFPAVASAVIASGAKLILCDVDPTNSNICISSLNEHITDKTRAVVITHYGGVPCKMQEICDYCEARGILVIEDAACALTAKYDERACGTIGDIGVWSFDAMKMITTGDGGAIYVKSTELKRKIDEYLYLGLPQKEKSGLDSAGGSDKAGWWEYELNDFGRRSIMNDISASIGVAQIGKISEILKRRNYIVEAYDQVMEQTHGISRLLNCPSNAIACPYFYTVVSDQRDLLALFLKENGVYSTFRYWPLHKIELFKRNSQTKSDFPGANFIASHCLNLPLHANLSEEEISKISKLIKVFDDLYNH